MQRELAPFTRWARTSGLLIFALAATVATARAAEEKRPPNLVVIFADDK